MSFNNIKSGVKRFCKVILLLLHVKWKNVLKGITQKLVVNFLMDTLLTYLQKLFCN